MEKLAVALDLRYRLTHYKVRGYRRIRKDLTDHREKVLLQVLKRKLQFLRLVVDRGFPFRKRLSAWFEGSG